MLCQHFLTCLVGGGLQSYDTCTYVVFKAEYGHTVFRNVGIRLPDMSSDLHRSENLKY
jgi:hypothetical protein